MLHLIPDPAPWYIAGPAMGLAVAGLYAVANKHLGVSGSYVQFVDAARGRPIEGWRIWFLGGILLGSALVSVLGHDPQTGLQYGRLGQLLSPGALALVLCGGGILIGFGARWAGACTSGYGLTGCSTRSTGGMAAITTFVVTAVAVTFILHAVTGGAL